MPSITSATACALIPFVASSDVVRSLVADSSEGIITGSGAECVAASDGEMVASDEEAASDGETGDVWCWGENRNGLVGNNGPLNGANPTLQQVMGLTGATQLVMGHNTACAIAGGGLYCWGNNHHGNITTRPPSDAAEQAIMQALRVPL